MDPFTSSPKDYVNKYRNIISSSDSPSPSSPKDYVNKYRNIISSSDSPNASSPSSPKDYENKYRSVITSSDSPNPSSPSSPSFYENKYRSIIASSDSPNASSPSSPSFYENKYRGVVDQSGNSSNTSSRSYLDSSAALKVSDYKLDPLELDAAIENVKNKPIPILGGNTVENYYNKELFSENLSSYSALLTNALSGKIKDKANLAKVGYFRKHLYENELSQRFSSSSPVGERRNAYEILVNAINNPLNIQDVNNPVNVEMQNVVMPEMMKLMANDGYKITVKKAGASKAYADNKSDATKEFTFDLDGMNWRTQMTSPEFTNYASKVIENLKNPSAKGGYASMYQQDVLDQRKSFATDLGGLRGGQAELSRVISEPIVDKDNAILSATVKNLDLILTDRLAYGSAYQSYEMAKNQLGDDNVFKTLIIKLANQGEFTVQSSKDRNKSINVNINNILIVEDGTNSYILNNKAVLEELSRRLKTYKK